MASQEQSEFAVIRRAVPPSDERYSIEVTEVNGVSQGGIAPPPKPKRSRDHSRERPTTLPPDELRTDGPGTAPPTPPARSHSLKRNSDQFPTRQFASTATPPSTPAADSMKTGPFIVTAIPLPVADAERRPLTAKNELSQSNPPHRQSRDSGVDDAFYGEAEIQEGPVYSPTAAAEPGPEDPRSKFEVFSDQLRENLRKIGKDIRNLPAEIRTKLRARRYSVSGARRQRRESPTEEDDRGDGATTPLRSKAERGRSRDQKRGSQTAIHLKRSRSLSLRREDFRRLSRRVRHFGQHIRSRIRELSRQRRRTELSESSSSPEYSEAVPAERGRQLQTTAGTSKSSTIEGERTHELVGRRRSTSVTSLREIKKAADGLSLKIESGKNQLQADMRRIGKEVREKSGDMMRKASFRKAVKPEAQFENDLLDILRTRHASSPTSNSPPGVSSGQPAVPLLPKVLTEIQAWKLTQLFHWLDANKDNRLTDDDFDKLAENIFRYTDWPFDSKNRKLVMERFSFFWDFLLEAAKEASDEKDLKDAVELELWLKVWAHLLKDAPAPGVLPHWVYMLPQILFLAVDFNGTGYISKPSLRDFYMRFLHLPAYKADYMTDLAYNRMTGNDNFCLTSPLYEVLFAEFILAKSMAGPGQYIFGIIKPGAEEEESSSKPAESKKESKGSKSKSGSSHSKNKPKSGKITTAATDAVGSSNSGTNKTEVQTDV